MNSIVENLGQRVRKLSEWRGFKTLSSLKIPTATSSQEQRSPFDDTGPVHLDLKPKVRKRQFTGILRSSDVSKLVRANRSRWVLHAALVSFLVLDVALFLLFLRG